MATMLSKLTKVEAVDAQEEREVIVRCGKKEIVIKDATLAEIIENAYEVDTHLKTIKEIAQGYKKEIAEKAKDFLGDKGTVRFIIETEEGEIIECKVTFQYEAIIPNEDVEEVRKILGERFEDLVRVKTVYVATPKLIELAADADKGQELRQYIIVKEKAAQITFTKEE